jgi:LSD1 subclass zinc finger protein
MLEGSAMEEELSHTREISCENCGAPLEYMEGEAVITCGFCGTTTMLAGYDNIVVVRSQHMLPPTVDRGQVEVCARNWLSRGFFKASGLKRGASITSVESLVLPYWIVRCSATTMWRGQRKKTRTTGSGDDKRTETYWEPVSGRFSEDYTWPVYARENREEFWGVTNLEPGKRCVFPDWGGFILRVGGSKRSPNVDLLAGAEDFDLEAVKGMRLVNGQIVQERAERQARDRIVELHAQRAEGKATRITDCDTTVDVLGVDLVYLPMWEIRYGYRGSAYHVLVNGHTGEVVSGEAPVGKWAKALVFDVFMAVGGGIFALLYAAADMAWALWPAVGFGALLAGYTLWTAFLARG